MIDYNLNAKEIELIRTGYKVRAITEYGIRTGLGVKEATFEVESFAKSNLEDKK